ncbi:hypothetical protein BH11PLA2_BH11PLA2_20830 [soil metagenome]
MTIACQTTKPAPGEQRHTTAAAICSAVPIRPICSSAITFAALPIACLVVG